MKNRLVVRLVLLAAIFTWPAVESYRYYVARQQLAASEQLQASMSVQVAQARAKHTTRTAQAVSTDKR